MQRSNSGENIMIKIIKKIKKLIKKFILRGHYKDIERN